MKYDVVVLGGGIVGMSCALHLQKRGMRVAVFDKGQPGRGTSYGHAGLIERSSVIPYAFPRRVGELLRYATNRGSALHFDPFYLPKLAPWLLKYWWHSAPKRLQQAGADLLPMIEQSIVEHDALAREAGSEHLISAQGWLEVCRTDETLALAIANAKKMQAYGLSAEALDQAALQALEPSLSDRLVGGVYWKDPKTTINPAGVVDQYVALFKARGGEVVLGDARTLAQQSSAGGWSLIGENRTVAADQVLLALGPWSPAVYEPLGYRFPLALKRGHHLHFASQDNGSLNRPVLDEVNGFVLSPMVNGVRMATGIDFSSPSSPPSMTQVNRAWQKAREIFPLGKQVEDKPWVGLRPCLPDMRPIIGPASKHKGLWFAFGHAHHGFTLGPITGRMVADMISGSDQAIDARPFSADRFN